MKLAELRLRNQLADGVVREMEGKLLTEAESSLRLTGPAKVLKPDGQPLCVYLPGALPEELRAAIYPDLSAIRGRTENRGMASGTPLMTRGTNRYRSKGVASSILGYFEASPPFHYCRTTAFTGREVESWDRIRPLFSYVAAEFEKYVPDRYAVQADYAKHTHSEWVVPGTPFTTITVNSTYPTGVHTDKGDLDKGFSALCTLRRGEYTGGHLTFPKYRLSVDMQDGDLILMDAHEFHGNTALKCSGCGANLDKYGHKCPDVHNPDWQIPERVSVVHYYRTKMAKCGTFDEEIAKAEIRAEQRSHV